MKRKARILALALGTMFVVSSTFCLSSTKIIDETLNLAEQTARQIFSQSEEETFGTVSAQYLSGLDGEKDYILVNRHPQGYAIFEKENMELMEYSEVGGSPYSSIDKNEIYYAGPAGYYQKEQDNVTHIYTKETIKAEEKAKIAQKVKEKIKKGKLEREAKKTEEKDVVAEEEVLTNSVMGIQQKNNLLTLGGTIGDLDDNAFDNPYLISNQKYIPDYKYFLSKPEHGYNGGQTENSCGIVAAQLLLSYNNWSKDGRIITNPDFLFNRTGIYDPYNENMIGTTSEVNSKDEVTTFFEELSSRIIWDDESGTLLLFVKWGIESYLDSVQNNNSIPYSMNLHTRVFNVSDPNELVYGAKQATRDQIEKGNPVIAGIEYYENATDTELTGHCVVVYGYHTLKINNSYVDGFVAHMGWRDATVASWFNESWLTGCLTLEIAPHGNNGEAHNDTRIYDEFGERTDAVRCSVCNRIAPADVHEFEEVMLSPNHQYYGLYHKKRCFCGYEELMYHKFIYVRSDPLYHGLYCLCGYSTSEEHSYKYDACFYCGEARSYH